MNWPTRSLPQYQNTCLTQVSTYSSTWFLLQVWTGETDPRLAQQWVRWQNNDTISLCFTPPCPPKAQTQPWATASANAVRGFTGRQYYRNTQTTDRLPFFDLYFLRVVDLVYQSSVKLFGLDLLRFIIDPATFRNKYENPANEQYFSDGYTGVVNMTSAVARAPFMMTKPHYLDADKALFSYVDGVSPPDRAAHDSYFDIEAETGAVLNGQVRVQANIRIGTVVLPDAARHTFFPNASTIVAPLYWFEDGGGIDEATADVFAKTVYLAHTVATASVWAGAIIGLALIGGGIVIAKRAADSRRAAGLSFFGLSVPPALPPSAPGSPRAGSAHSNDSAAASLLGANSALSPSAFYQAANFSPGGRAPPGARPDSIEFK
jgi:hypothetical protein